MSDCGFYLSQKTSVFDDSLEQAVLNFQTAHGIQVDGIVGVETKLLFFSLLRKNIPRIMVCPLEEKK